MSKQQEMWEALRLELISRIAEIDVATPWQEVEPEWWLRMMAVRNAAALRDFAAPSTNEGGR